MASKKGDKYQCEDCGLVMMVDTPCGCEPVDIVCCGTPMKPVAAAKAKPKAKPKASPKSSPKTKK